MPKMMREEIFGELRSTLGEQLGVEDDAMIEQANFQDDLGADSLDLVEVIMSLEDRYDIKIDDADAQKLTTVGEALDYLVEKQPESGFNLKDKPEGGEPTGVREPVPVAPVGGADGTTAEEATTEQIV